MHLQQMDTMTAQFGSTGVAERSCVRCVIARSETKRNEVGCVLCLLSGRVQKRRSLVGIRYV
jgi:hypothetical protein